MLKFSNKINSPTFMYLLTYLVPHINPKNLQSSINAKRYTGYYRQNLQVT